MQIFLQPRNEAKTAMIRKLFTLLSFHCLFLQSALTQAPQNDNCSQAIPLGLTPTCPTTEYSNKMATPSANEVNSNPYCSTDGNNDRDVWFTFNASAGSDYNISVQSSGNKGILWPNVGIYRGDCNPGGLVKICSDSLFVSERLMSVNVFGLSNGENYYVRVADQKGTGNFHLCITGVKNLTLTDNSSTECAGVLYDSGGPDKDYRNNENSLFTICPKDEHQCIRFTLSNYNFETGDSIIFYNGPDTTAPIIRKIIGQDFNSGFNAGGAGFDVYATDACLTIRFMSDSAGVYEGFYGKWLCSPEACPVFKGMTLTPEPDSKTIEAAVARPGTQVRLTKTTCGNGKFNFGTFNATDNSDLGLGTGIVLSSGDIRKINQPAELLSSTSLKLRGDADLDSLSIIEGGSISRDACVIEFDVFANTDEINFEYIFGSEEYPEFISDPTFYDIFALMIDGPGIIGDPKIFPKKNLAVLPNGTQISIGQVNSTSNYEFYRNNFDGKEMVYNGLTTGRNGLKKTLTASSKVIPCNTYRLKLAIADRGDENFDSGVFIGDIKGSAPIITFNSALGLENLIENCSGSGERIVFRLNSPANVALSFQVEFSGSAIRGTDFESSVPAVITFPAGITELAFPLNVFGDNLTEKDEFIEIKLLKNYGCGLNIVATTKIYIKDNLSLQLNVQDSFYICRDLPGYRGKLLTVTGANRYHWQTDSAFSNPFNDKTYFKPSKSGWFYVTGTTENCTIKDSFWVELIQPELRIDTLSKTSICEGESITLIAYNNFGNQFLEWLPESLLPNNKLDTVTFKPKFTGQVVVRANIGACTASDTLSFRVNRINMPFVSKKTEACYREKIKLSSATFAPDSKFTWAPVGPSDPNQGEVFIQALSSQQYILKGTSNSCTAYDTATVIVSGTVTIVGPDTVRICKGTKRAVKADIETGSSASSLSFSWQSKAAQFTASDSIETILTALKSGWIYAEIKTAKCTVKDSVFLLVDSLPENPGLNIVPLKPYYCEGDTILLYSASMPLPLYPSATFQWQDPVLGALSSVNKANLKFVALKSALYIRTTNNASCHRTDTFSLKVLPKLPDLEVDNDTICAGQKTVLEIKNKEQYEKFEWKPAGALSCPDCSNPSTMSGGLYTVTATSTGFCPAIKTVTVVEKGIRLFINAGKTVFCPNEQVETRLNVSPAKTVTWSPSAGLSCADCPDPVLTKAGVFTATVVIDGCLATDTIEIIQVSDTIGLPAGIRICKDEPVEIVVSNDSLLRDFSIDPLAEKTGNTLIITEIGNYLISAKTQKGDCPLTRTMNVRKGSIPAISIAASPHILTLNNQEIKLSTTGNSNLQPNSLVWQDNTTGPEYSAKPKAAKTDFWIRGISIDGCPGSDSISIYSLAAPTIFSPGSPTDNAFFKVFQLPPPEVAEFKSLIIFDRWGNVVFETHNADQTWNGDKYPSDVYVFYLTFELAKNKETVILKGDLTLIR